MKVCRNPECHKAGEPQPLEAFYRDRYARDGRKPRCAECHKTGTRDWYSRNRETEIRKSMEWQARNPEATRATRIRYRANRKADPERGAIFRDYQREWKRAKTGVAPEDYRTHIEGGDAMVPVAPIRAAVEWSGLSWSEIGGRCGIDESAIRRGLQQDKMNAAKAGKILDAIGSSPAEVGI